MTTDAYPTALSPENLTSTMTELKARLQSDYEKAYPRLAEIIHLVIEAEEANAWELSFPHLFLPDLVEAHLARLNLQPATTRLDAAIAQVKALSQSVLGNMRDQIGFGDGAQNATLIQTQLEPAAQH